MAFESVFKNKEHCYHPRITKNGLLYLRELEIKDIKKYKFVHVKIEKSRRLLGLIFSETNPDKNLYKVSPNGNSSLINIKPILKLLKIKLTEKFYIEKINEEDGMYIIDLKDAK